MGQSIRRINERFYKKQFPTVSDVIGYKAFLAVSKEDFIAIKEAIIGEIDYNKNEELKCE